MKLHSLFILTVLPLLVAACGETIAEGPAKSLEYYSKHPAETQQVAAKCLKFDKNEFSVMSPSKQQAWSETTAGINCNNAKTAYEFAMMSARQQRMIDAAAKYH